MLQKKDSKPSDADVILTNNIDQLKQNLEFNKKVIASSSNLKKRGPGSDI